MSAMRTPAQARLQLISVTLRAEEFARQALEAAFAALLDDSHDDFSRAEHTQIAVEAVNNANAFMRLTAQV